MKAHKWIYSAPDGSQEIRLVLTKQDIDGLEESSRNLFCNLDYAFNIDKMRIGLLLTSILTETRKEE